MGYDVWRVYVGLFGMCDATSGPVRFQTCKFTIRQIREVRLHIIHFDTAIPTCAGDPSEGISGVIVRGLRTGDGDGVRRHFSSAIPIQGGDGGHMSDRETIEEAPLAHLEVPAVDGAIVHTN